MGNLITLHEQKLDGTPRTKKRKISKLFFLAASFHSTTDPLVSKLVRLSSLLELELKFSFELENNLGIEDMNESLRGLRFHLVLDT